LKASAYTKRHKNVVFHQFAQKAPSAWICAKLGLGDTLTVVINCAKFCFNQPRGFDSVGGQNSPSPLTWPVTVNSVLALSCTL